MTENFEEKLSRLTELLEKQIEAYADLNDTTKKTERQQKKALEDSILQEKGYKKVNGEIISVEEDRIKAEEKLTQELYDKFGKEKVLNQKIQDEYNKQLKSITDVIKGSIEITDAQKQNLLELKKSNEYIAAQQASEFKKQAEALGAIVQSNGKLNPKFFMLNQMQLQNLLSLPRVVMVQVCLSLALHAWTVLK